MKKIYSVKWEDGDGENGYFVELSKPEVEKVKRFLDEAAAADTIKNPQIDAIEKPWLLTIRGFIKEFRDHYGNA